MNGHPAHDQWVIPWNAYAPSRWRHWIGAGLALYVSWRTHAQITFVGSPVDLGRVAPGQRVPLSLEFTNRGSALVVITNVERSCSCLDIQSWTRRVAAGSAGRVEGVFYVPEQVGPLEERITLQGSPGGDHLAHLDFRGRVWQPIEARPGFVSLSPASLAPTLVQIVNQTDTPVELSEPLSDQKRFRATLTALKPGWEFQLAIEPVPPFPNANVFGRIRIKISSDLMKEVLVSVFLPAPTLNRNTQSSNSTPATGTSRPAGP
ncbi:MAG: DUF1573 domain-containing protein [Verrucomicrobiales bacterium]|nr:DUF1573 domain-containing protein [Verrucomicrobiales bacterium]